MSLVNWGWSVYCAHFPLERFAFEIARVIAPFGHELLLATQVGEQTSRIRGLMQRECGVPVVGDWVGIRDGLIERILPRYSQIARVAPGGALDLQTLAANIDLLVITSGLDRDFNLRRLERYLVLAAASGAEPLIVLTKADLCDDSASMLHAARGVAWPYEVILSSALDGAGARLLRDRIAGGRTAALLGSSGAGKSTLVNLLLGSDRQRVASVREEDSRGRHTTTHRQMFHIDGGGLLIDQPGLREIQLTASPEALDGAFADIAALAQSCRFRDCRHESEPGCAVREVTERGEMEEGRLRNFAKLRRETERAEEEFDPVARTERKRKIKAIHKAMRGHLRI